MLLPVGLLLMCSGVPVFAQTQSALQAAGRDRIVYVVRKDETLSGIASTLTGRVANWQVIGRLNRIENDRTIPVGTRLLVPAHLLPAGPANARVISVSGEVLIQKRNGTPAAASTGELVGEGDKLVTRGDGFLSLGLDDGTRIMLRPETAAEFRRLRTNRHLATSSTQIFLERGRVESQVTPVPVGRQPSYEIISPKAVSSVRGTSFRVKVDASRVLNETLSGKVAFANAARAGGSVARQERMIGKGFGAIVENGRVGTPVALLEAPSLDDGYLVQDRLPVQFPLRRDGATALHVTISKDAGATEVVDAASASTTMGAATIRFADLPDGRYFLHASAADAAGLQGIPASSPFLLKARPFPPVLLQRQDRLQASAPGQDGAVQLEWTRQEGVAGYRLQVAADAGFTSPAVDQSVGGGTGSLEARLRPGIYYWRVASMSLADGKPDQGPYSDPRRLRVLDAQAVPSAQPTEAGMRLDWSGGPERTYEFQLAGSSTFDRLLIERKVDAPTVLLPDLPPGTYHVRVRSLYSDGFVGAFSSPQAFEVPLRWRSGYGETWKAGSQPVGVGFDR